MQELDDEIEQDDIDVLSESFAPRWSECVGMFNETDSLSRRENEQTHHRKHAVIGNEWRERLTLSEYLEKAVFHLNDLSADSVIELCQTEDFAVVKYNLETGELGIARRADGTIKTFFRPNDISYILRKLNAGLWGEPDIVDGFETQPLVSDFADDAEKLYLYERLEALALELPAQAHSIVLTFTVGQPSPSDIFSLVGRLGEYRFVSFELQKAILTEAQEKAVYALRKKISIAAASFEALEKYKSEDFIQAVEVGLDRAITAQEELWHQASQLVINSDQLEESLTARQSLGYALLELKILQIQHRLSELDLTVYQQRLKKSDIYFRDAKQHLFAAFGNNEVQEIYSKIIFTNLN